MPCQCLNFIVQPTCDPVYGRHHFFCPYFHPPTLLLFSCLPFSLSLRLLSTHGSSPPAIRISQPILRSGLELHLSRYRSSSFSKCGFIEWYSPQVPISPAVAFSTKAINLQTSEHSRPARFTAPALRLALFFPLLLASLALLTTSVSSSNSIARECTSDQVLRCSPGARTCHPTNTFNLRHRLQPKGSQDM